MLPDASGSGTSDDESSSLLPRTDGTVVGVCTLTQSDGVPCDNDSSSDVPDPLASGSI
jgi:hypothetical protein